jgi:peptide/nickel transport system permease protein
MHILIHGFVTHEGQQTQLMSETATSRIPLKPLQSAWQFARRWPVIPVIVLLVLVLVGIFAPWISPYDPIDQSLPDRNAPPFWVEGSQHILGADHVGRDVLSRLIHGARISLTVMAVSLSTGLVIGTALGLIGGYFGGVLDEIVMRIVDIWMGFPFLLIALVVAVVFGSSFVILMGLLALLAWSHFVRNVRADVLVLKSTDYVALAKVSGASTVRILLTHIVPGIVGTVTVIASLRVGQLILMEATLSFLGAGVPAPTPSWGLMISDGRDYLQTAWWTSTFPGIAIFFTVMALNFLGDWLRDRLDPRLRQI